VPAGSKPSPQSNGSDGGRCVGDGGGKSATVHHIQIVDVISQKRCFGERDSPTLEVCAKRSDFVIAALQTINVQFFAPGGNNRVPLRRDNHTLDPALSEHGQTKPVASRAPHRFMAGLVDINGVVGENPVEIECGAAKTRNE